MTEKRPPDDSDFASFDDLPKRVKQPQWRWWKQPLGIAILFVLAGTIAVVMLINRGRIVLEQPVTVLVDVPTADDTNPLAIRFRGLDLGLNQLSLSRDLPDLTAGDQACLQIKDRPLNELPRYTLLPLDAC